MHDDYPERAIRRSASLATLRNVEAAAREGHSIERILEDLRAMFGPLSEQEQREAGADGFQN